MMELNGRTMDTGKISVRKAEEQGKLNLYSRGSQTEQLPKQLLGLMKSAALSAYQASDLSNAAIW